MELETVAPFAGAVIETEGAVVSEGGGGGGGGERAGGIPVMIVACNSAPSSGRFEIVSVDEPLRRRIRSDEIGVRRKAGVVIHGDVQRILDDLLEVAQAAPIRVADIFEDVVA